MDFSGLNVPKSYGENQRRRESQNLFRRPNSLFAGHSIEPADLPIRPEPFAGPGVCFVPSGDMCCALRAKMLCKLRCFKAPNWVHGPLLRRR